MDNFEIMCNECFWAGYTLDLLCSERDMESDKPASKIEFIYCPNCGGTDISEYDGDD